MKKIAILLTNLCGGGAERISVNLANCLAKRGYVVDMVLLSAKGEFLADLRPEIRVVDLHVKRMRGVLLPLVRYMRSYKPDALLACMWPLTSLSVIAKMLARVATRIVVAEHNTWSKSQVEYSFLHRFVIRKSMHVFHPKADAIVTVSNGAADDLATFAGLPRDTISMIYNPVLGASITHSAKAVISGLEQWKAAPFRVLTVGTLKDQKNHKLLLKAYSVIVKRMNSHLLILGEGHLREKLEQLVDELGIRASVSIPGFVSDPSPYYQHASLLALSSDWEGLPTVVIEALAFGTPVVSTDCPSGPREILCDGKFGRLVPVGDVEALAAAMAESLSTKHDHEALKARAQDFSIDKAVNQYLELLFPKGNHPETVELNQ